MWSVRGGTIRVQLDVVDEKQDTFASKGTSLSEVAIVVVNFPKKQ